MKVDDEEETQKKVRQNEEPRKLKRSRKMPERYQDSVYLRFKEAINR